MYCLFLLSKTSGCYVAKRRILIAENLKNEKSKKVEGMAMIEEVGTLVMGIKILAVNEELREEISNIFSEDFLMELIRISQRWFYQCFIWTKDLLEVQNFDINLSMLDTFINFLSLDLVTKEKMMLLKGLNNVSDDGKITNLLGDAERENVLGFVRAASMQDGEMLELMYDQKLNDQFGFKEFENCL